MTAGVNNELIVEMRRAHWNAGVETLDDAAIPVTITIPAGDYPNWDDTEVLNDVGEVTEIIPGLCSAIQEAGRAAIRAATLDLQGNFYCWKETIPNATISNMGHSYETQVPWGNSSIVDGKRVSDLDISRIHLVYWNRFGGWYMNEVSAATSSAATALGLGSSDIPCSTVSITDLATMTERISTSGVDGRYTLDAVTPYTASGATCTIKVRPLAPGEYSRNLSDVRIGIYRTENGGTTYHRVGEAANVFSDYEVSFLDTMSDAEALTKPVAYTTGEPGDVLEHTTPVGRILWTHRDRVWVVDDENPCAAFVSTPKQAGYANEFSEFIKVQLPEPITAGASLGDVSLLWTASKLYGVSGQGPDAMGLGEFAAPRELAAAGADNYSCVCTAGDSVVWYSLERGLWMMDRSYQAQEIGKPILDSLAGVYPVVAMLDRPDERRLEIILSSGTALWYDYRFQRWTTQTLHTGVNGACYHDSTTWHVADTTGSHRICYQSGGLYTRNGTAFAMKVTTYWIKVGALTGLQRVWVEHILGDWRDSHSLRVRRWVDYITATVDSDKTVAVTTDPGPYLLKHHPRTQRCSAMKLEISDVPTGAGQAACRLSALELVCGIRPGSMHRGKDF
jgi:hypothetical protein